MKTILLFVFVAYLIPLSAQVDPSPLTDDEMAINTVNADDFALIDAGYSLSEKITIYPQRLDFRFERIHELYMEKDWKRLTNEALLLIDLSYTNQHNWTWSEDYDAIGNDPEQFVTSTIQDYVLMLYLANDPKLHDNIRSISKVMLNYQPKHVDFICYQAMTYTAEKNIQKRWTFY